MLTPHLLDERFADAASPRRYIELVNATSEASSGAVVDSPLDAMQQVVMREAPDVEREMAETVFLALRLREGLDMAGFEARFGVGMNRVFGQAIEETMSLGLTEQVGGRLRVKDEAVLLGDEAFVRFLEPQPIES